jgi:hypothetical protein
MTKRLVKLVLSEAKENCILKERRLEFWAEGTFRPYFDNAPYPHWWSALEKVRTCLQSSP